MMGEIDRLYREAVAQAKRLREENERLRSLVGNGNLGKVILDEMPLDITRIQLAEGQVVISAVLTGDKLRRFDQGSEMTLFAPDGTVVVHQPKRRKRKVHNLGRDDELTVTWRWNVTPLEEDHEIHDS